MQHQRKRKATSPPADAPASAKQVVTYPTPTSRKPSAHTTPGAVSNTAPVPFLKDNERLPVQSPSSIEGGRSIRQDDSSSRSTPQPQQTALTNTSGQLIISGMEPIDVLHASVAETVSLQVALEAYRGEVKKLDAENALFKSIFITNPTLKAARTKARIDKIKQVEACETLLVERKAAEQEAWQAMWQSLQAQYDAKLHADIYAGISTDLASRANMVSRADYDILAKSHSDLKNELAAQKVMLQDLQKVCGAVEQVSSRADRIANTANSKVGQVPNVLIRLNDLEGTVSANANDVELKMKQHLQQTSGFSTRLQSLEKVVFDASPSQKDVKILQNLVRDHEQLARTVNDTMIPKIGRQSNEITTLSKDLELTNTRLDSCTNNVSTHTESIKRLTNTVEKGFSACRDDTRGARAELSILSNRIEELKSSVPREGSKDRQVDKDEVKKLREQLHSVHEQVVQFEARFEEHRERFDELRADCFEEGKPNVVKRLKKHDQHINNSSTKISKLDEDQSKMLKRIDKLESTLHLLDQRVKNVKDRPAAIPQTVVSDPDTIKRVIELENSLSVTRKALEDLEKRPIITPQVAFGETPTGGSDNTTVLFASIDSLHDLLIKLREKVDGLEEEAGDKDVMVSEEIQNLQTQLSSEIAALDDRCRQQLQAEITRLTQQHEAVSGDQGSAIAANQRAISLLEAGSVSMVEKVQLMERRPTIPPPATLNGPQQFKPLSRSSPAVQSPRTNNLNSPQVNGNHGPAASQQEVDNIRNQFAALSGFCNHLKQRFDNLTTDEVVKKMIGQMSEIYPAPGEFQIAVMQLSQRDKELQDKIEKLSNGITNHWNQMTEFTGQSHSAVKMATEAKAVAHEAKLLVAETSGYQYRQQLANIERRIQELSTRTVYTAPQRGNDDPILKSLPNKLNEQTTAIKKRLDDIEAKTNDHSKKYDHLPDAFFKLGEQVHSAANDLGLLNARANKMDALINQQFNVANTLKQDISTLTTEQTKTNASKDQLSHDIEQTSSLAQSLEDEVKDLKKLPPRVSAVEGIAEELNVAKGTILEEFIRVSTKLEQLEERVEEAHGKFEKLEKMKGGEVRKAR